MTFDEMILSAPRAPGIYKMFGADDVLLYVGKAKNLINRLRQYRGIDKLEWHKIIMRRQVVRVEWQTTNSEADALVLEQNLIKAERPKYNIILKDDKMYPYLGFSKHEHPRLYKFRDKMACSRLRPRAHFGPFPLVKDLNETIKLLQKTCGLRTCADGVFEKRTRPCLLGQIGRCSAPCVVPDPDYKGRVRMAKNILRGHLRSVVSDLTRQMTAASNALDFEAAAKIKFSIDALKSTAA